MPIIDKSILIKYLNQKLIKFYHDNIKSNKGLSIEDYIAAQNFSYEDWIADISAVRRAYKKARVKTKINWFNCAVRDLQLRKPGSPVIDYYAYMAAGDVTLSWENYVDKMLTSLNEWRHDTKSLLTEYPFIEKSPLKTKELAFTKEVALNIIDLLGKNIGVYPDNSDYPNDVLLQPLEFILGPFVSIYSPGTELTVGKDSNNGKTVLYDDYKVPYTEHYGDLIIRSYIETSDITKYESNIRTLSTFDISVFLYIINYVCENYYSTFLVTRTFQNSLSEIVKAVFPNEKKPSARCYNKVKNSLLKLSSLQVKGIRNNEVVRSMNFFTDYQLDEDNGQQIVTLVVGSYVYDRIATKKAQLISREVKVLTDRSAQFVYYVFENERQKAYASNSINKELEYKYQFFLHTMRFPSRYSVKSNMDLIDSIFKMFIDNDILLQSYTRKPKSFILKFKQFTKDDIIKLKLSEPTLLT